MQPSRNGQDSPMSRAESFCPWNRSYWPFHVICLEIDFDFTTLYIFSVFLYFYAFMPLRFTFSQGPYVMIKLIRALEVDRPTQRNYHSTTRSTRCCFWCLSCSVSSILECWVLRCFRNVNQRVVNLSSNAVGVLLMTFSHSGIWHQKFHL